MRFCALQNGSNFCAIRLRVIGGAAAYLLETALTSYHKKFLDKQHKHW